MKKLLVIGGSGLVGSTLIEYAKSNYDIHFTINKNESCFDNIPFTKIDLMKNKFEISNLINNFNPDVVIHTAAHSSVDLCETDHKLANFLHIDVTKDIARVCHEINAKLIYFSTDAVFDGKMNKKYLESDTTNPINYYGKTKLDAEKIILNQSTKNVILRPSVIYGWHKKSRFTNWIIESLKNESSVDPHVDQYNTPTLVDDLVKSILLIIEKDISGLFHSTGKTCINRYELANIIADIFGFDKKLIKPVTSNEKKQDAPRPKKTCLDSSKLEKTIDYQFTNISEGIQFLHDKSLA
ncbi:SDR family oxidoreductase [bacterium]|jgi:dTDP-4-dehydrorhamnose reductase|nr:SDR family oxidoreductase [bacterium]